MNPATWFGNDEEKTTSNDDFDFDEFDAANGEKETDSADAPSSQEFDEETETADAALKNDEFAVDEAEE